MMNAGQPLMMAEGRAELPIGKRAQNALRIRNAIIDAMTQLIGEKGYDRATIAEILQLAGVSLGTFYKHFDSKQAILLSIMEREHLLRQRFLEEALAADYGAPVDYLMGAVEAATDTADTATNLGVWREVIAGSISQASNPEVAAGLREDRQRYTDNIMLALRRLVKDGVLRPEAPLEALAQALFCIAAYEFQTFVCAGYADAAEHSAQLRRMVEATIGPWQKAS